MQISWTSKKGLQRKFNNDAGAVGYCENYLIVVIVDAAERYVGSQRLSGLNAQRKRLAQHWADTILFNAVVTKTFLCEKKLLSLLYEEQKKLRHYFLHDIASYGLLLLDTKSGELRWWFTGDCRMGIQSALGEIRWLNAPHRLDNFSLAKAVPEKSIMVEEQQAARNTLTRSLNAKRFYFPEQVNSELLENEFLLLATDGYWYEHKQQAKSLESLDDDVSLFAISSGKKSLKSDADTSNLFVMYR